MVCKNKLTTKMFMTDLKRLNDFRFAKKRKCLNFEYEIKEIFRQCIFLHAFVVKFNVILKIYYTVINFAFKTAKHC